MNQNQHQTQNNINTPNIQPTQNNINRVLYDAHGAVPYSMTNDYMFRAVLQTNNKALRGLICSLLHLSEEEVDSVRIQNGILLGETIEHKEVRLDVNVLLNNHTLINLEMQIANRLNWQKRSIIYLCRSFDSLTHGQDYIEAKSVIHIGFLDYTLFDNYPEFYASHKLLNVKNQHKYSDNITLNVVDLTRIDLATEEDKQYHIHDWAALFKAATWEEIKMLAVKNKYLNEAAKTMFQLSADEQILKQCRDREEYYQDLKNYEQAIAERDSTIAECNSTIAECNSIITECNSAIAERDGIITKCNSTIAKCNHIIAEKDALIQQLLAENNKLRM